MPHVSADAARSVLTVAVYQSGGRVGVLLGSVQFSAAPGSTINIPMVLQNRGLNEDTFRLDVQGIPASWISTNSARSTLEPSASREVQLTIRVPRSSEAVAGRMPFIIIVSSEEFPDQRTEVDCILTISTFWKFSASVNPETVRADQPAHVILSNEGNITDTYTLNFQGPANALVFEKKVPVSTVGPRPEKQRNEVTYVEIPRVVRVSGGTSYNLTHNPGQDRQPDW